MDLCLKALETQVNTAIAKDDAKEIVAEAAQTEVGNFASEQLKDLVANMFPEANKVTDMADVAATENLCEKIEEQHREFVAKITQSSSKANTTVEDIQSYIAKLLNDQQKMKDELDRLKSENESLNLTISSLTVDDIEKGKDGRKAKQTGARKPQPQMRPNSLSRPSRSSRRNNNAH